jgi:hypothetical protein
MMYIDWRKDLLNEEKLIYFLFGVLLAPTSFHLQVRRRRRTPPPPPKNIKNNLRMQWNGSWLSNSLAPTGWPVDHDRVVS